MQLLENRLVLSSGEDLNVQPVNIAFIRKIWFRFWVFFSSEEGAVIATEKSPGSIQY